MHLNALGWLVRIKADEWEDCAQDEKREWAASDFVPLQVGSWAVQAKEQG